MPNALDLKQNQRSEMGRKLFLPGLECRWMIVVFVFSYFVANFIGVYSISRPCLEVRKRMKYNKRHAVKTFQSEDGDTVDCVDIYKQPAFDHPALRNHKVQAALLVAAVTRFVGSKGRLNVWNPRVASADDYNTSQIWLLSGGLYDYGSLESGWMVNPKLYGDTQTRFFIHWTNDGSQNTGCFDLLCSGFVQTSQEIALGAAINPLSSEGGAQYEITVQISMDAKTANWWVRVDDKIDLGYWPSSLLSDYLRMGASLAQWGGEVYSPNVGQVPHTSTALGSGHWAIELSRGSCYIAGISTMDFPYTWKYPQYVGTLSDEPNCYTVYHHLPKFFFDEPRLYFGGPGSFRNPRCP